MWDKKRVIQEVDLVLARATGHEKDSMTTLVLTCGRRILQVAKGIPQLRDNVETRTSVLHP